MVECLLWVAMTFIYLVDFLVWFGSCTRTLHLLG